MIRLLNLGFGAWRRWLGSAGFSHIECLCVIAIAGVFAGLVGNIFRDVGASYQLHQAKVLLAEAVELTRLQALHDHDVRCLCVSLDDRQCDVDWQGDHLIIAHAKGSRLASLPWLDSISLRWHGNLAHNGPLCFGPLGFSLGQKGHFVLRCGEQLARFWVDFRVNGFA